MELPQRKRLYHDIPSWVQAEAVFFVTICLKHRVKYPIAGRESLKVERESPKVGRASLKVGRSVHASRHVSTDNRNGLSGDCALPNKHESGLSGDCALPTDNRNGLRGRCALPIKDSTEPLLTQPEIATKLLESVERLHDDRKWWCDLCLLMPDHLHMLVSFPREVSMSTQIAAYKSYQARKLPIQWQDSFFDHRIRSAQEFEEKAAYIRQNPVRAKLIDQSANWPYVWPKSKTAHLEPKKD